MTFPQINDENGEFLDQVQLKGMLLSCVIGIFPNERHKKQPVTIDLCLYLNTRPAAASTHIYDTVDYSAVVKEISFILEQCEFLLIETAVEAVCKYFLAIYCRENNLPQVDAVCVKISKPSALTHGIIPSIQIARRRAFENTLPVKSSTLEGQEIHKSTLGLLRLLKLEPQKTISFSNKAENPKSVFTLGKFLLGNTAVKPHTTLPLDDNPLELTNSGDQSQILIVFS